MSSPTARTVEETRLIRMLLQRVLAGGAGTPKDSATAFEALCAVGGPLRALAEGLKAEQERLGDLATGDALDAHTRIGHAAAAIETAIAELTSARESLRVL